MPESPGSVRIYGCLIRTKERAAYDCTGSMIGHDSFARMNYADATGQRIITGNTQLHPLYNVLDHLHDNGIQVNPDRCQQRASSRYTAART